MTDDARTLTKAALSLADAGWPVFPTGGEDGKKPLGRWKDQATTDPDEVAALFRGRSVSQIGVSIPEGMWIPDVDHEDALPLALEVLQETPRGNFHGMPRLLGELKATQGPRPWGDVKVGGKGYVVAWQPDRWPTVEEIEGTPDEEVVLLEKPKRAQPATEAELDIITKSERDDELFRRAAAMKDLSIPPSAIVAAFEELDKLGGIEQPEGDRITTSDFRRIASSAWTNAGPPPKPIKVRQRRREADPAGFDGRGIDASVLLDKDLPPLRYIVDGLLPEGTTVLSAPPKIGKSWLVYEMCVELALDGEVLGRAVAPGSVLYYALEDGEIRGQDRLRKVLQGRRLPAGKLRVQWSAPKLGQGLEEELASWLDDHPDARLVAIDTLQKIRPNTSGKRNQYEVDVEDLGRVQDLMRNRGVALLVVHHVRKQRGDDFLETVSGTYGITGSADTTLVISRKRLESEGLVFVTGRDVEEAEIPVHFDGALWTKSDRLPHVTDRRNELYQFLVEFGEPVFAAEIHRVSPEMGTRESIQLLLQKLHEDGAVKRTRAGYAPAIRVVRTQDTANSAYSEEAEEAVVRTASAERLAARARRAS